MYHPRFSPERDIWGQENDLAYPAGLDWQLFVWLLELVLGVNHSPGGSGGRASRPSLVRKTPIKLKPSYQSVRSRGNARWEAYRQLRQVRPIPQPLRAAEAEKHEEGMVPTLPADSKWDNLHTFTFQFEATCTQG